MGKGMHMYGFKWRLLDPHLTGEETEAQVGEEDGSRSHG